MIALGLIAAYQQLLSPDHSWLRARYPYGFCKFYPTCSEYARQAVEKKGVFRGIIQASTRVLRCSPFSKGAIDNP